MTVIFRADASAEIGSGHVVRCAVLAQMAKSRGHDVSIVTSEISSELSNWLEEQGIDVSTLGFQTLASDAASTGQFTHSLGSGDWLVVDHYGLDAAWERAVNRGCGRLLVIDDLANRPHVCDALLDVGMHTRERNPYAGLIPDEAQLFFGPPYALVRDEFLNKDRRERKGSLRHVLIYLGGGLGSGASLRRIAAALERWNRTGLSAIFLANPCDLNEISSALAGNPNFRGISPMANMVELLDWADLVIGTCGNSTWERLLLGVPSICLVTAPNQKSDAELLAEAGAIVNLGDWRDVREMDILKALMNLDAYPISLSKLSEAGRRIMEGRSRAMERLFGLFDDGG